MATTDAIAKIDKIKRITEALDGVKDELNQLRESLAPEPQPEEPVVEEAAEVAPKATKVAQKRGPPRAGTPPPGPAQKRGRRQAKVAEAIPEAVEDEAEQ